MKKKTLANNGEIDTIDFIRIIWFGKIKIISITLLSLIVAIAYIAQKPNSFLFSLNVQPSKNSEFVKFIPVNKFLIEKLAATNPLDLMGKNEKKENFVDEKTLINEITIYDRFIEEFMDYDELIFVLEKNSYVRKNISELSNKEKQNQLYKYAMLFNFEKIKKSQSDFVLKFIWHNKQEGIKIIEEALDLTLDSLNKSVFEDLDFFFKTKQSTIKTEMNTRIDFLKEQSQIARELNIADNQVAPLNLAQPNISLNINTAHYAYYLRGYKAIDKEIDNIQKRDHKALTFIKEEIRNLKNQDINWVEFNLFSMGIESAKNQKKILLLAIGSGLIIGLFYVFISYSVQSSNIARKN